MRIIKIIVGIILLVFTVLLSLKTYEKFVPVNCTTITDCKTCAKTMGCTYCGVAKKCVNTENENMQCVNDKRTPENTFFNSEEDCIDCSAIKDCKTCAEIDPCAWCKTSNKCVQSSKTSSLCPRESYAIDKDACETTRTDISGIPYTYNAEASREEIRRQLASGAYSSNIVGSSTSSPSGTYSSNILGSSTSSPSDTYTTFDFSDVATQYPGTSIIPILGLSRDINDRLTRESLKTVVQAAKNLGYMINTEAAKQKLLEDVEKENDFYITQKKNYMKKYLNNSIDYVNDAESLNKMKDLDMRIMDLSDISGFIKGINVKSSDFIEGYQNINQKDVFEYTLQKNKTTTGYIEYLWALNLIALGTFVYFINK
jgi:hypothetical protein